MNSGNEPVWSKVKAVPVAQDSATRPIPLHNPGPRPPAAKGIAYGPLAWEHKFSILGFMLLGVFAGAVYITFTKPVYTASSTVELLGRNTSFMNMATLDPQGGLDAGASAPNMLTQLGLLKSRTLMNRAVERMNLELTPQVSVPATVFTRLRNRLPFFRQDPLVESRDALRQAVGSISASQVGLTRLIEIQCTSTSPDVAASFVNTLTSEYTQITQAARSNVTQATSEWMASQLEEAKSRLQDAGDKLRDFVQKSGMDFFPEQTTLADSKMVSLRANLSAIQADRIAKQSLWELAQKTPSENLPDVMNDPQLQNTKVELTTLRREMADLTSTLMPQHPKVQKLQAQITETENALEREKTSLLKRVQSDYDEALRRQTLLAGAYNAQTHSLSAQADKSAQYALLKREVDTEQQLYNSLLQESNQAALIAMAPSNSIRVVDTAVRTAIPAKPRPSRDIPASGLAGAILGYGLVLLRETNRRKRIEMLFDKPGYTQTVLGVPELGVIPSTHAVQPVRKLLIGVPWRRPQLANNSEGYGVLAGNGHSTPVGSGFADGERSAVLSESFRQTLVSLLRTKPSGHNPVYVITSAGPGEGKTTLSANLARAMAEIGQRVLLVDADLRRPHVHSLLGLGEHAGLSDILAGPVEPQDLTLDSFIQPTQIENLSVMAHGLTESIIPLFFSPRVAELVALLQTRFDCVLLDTAPSLPFPDARLWGRHSDGVVLVVRSGMTTREGAAAACERFLSDGIPVLGTILNDWTPKNGSNQVYYSYASGIKDA